MIFNLTLHTRSITFDKTGKLVNFLKEDEVTLFLYLCTYIFEMSYDSSTETFAKFSLERKITLISRQRRKWLMREEIRFVECSFISIARTLGNVGEHCPSCSVCRGVYVVNNSLTLALRMGDIVATSLRIIPAYLSIFTRHPIDAWLARAAYLAFLHGLFVTCRVLLPHFFNILSPSTGEGGT